MTNKLIKIHKVHLGEIFDYVIKQLPNESCGLLAGKNNLVEQVLFVKNQANSPFRFIMDPSEQLKAFNWIDDHSLDLLAIFHSHPNGPETISKTDIAEAAYDVIHIICSPGENQWIARGFWIVNEIPTEIPINILE